MILSAAPSPEPIVYLGLHVPVDSVKPENASAQPVPAMKWAADSWPEVLQAIEELREFFRDYAELMQDTWAPDGITEEKRTLILFHQGLFERGPTPADQMGRVADLYKKLLDVIRKENLSFRIPTRSALIPESENPAMEDLSLRVKDFNRPLERMIGQVRQLDAASAGELEDRLRSLYSAIASLFKGIIRKDWDDVELVLNHINLVTTSSKSRGLVRQMAQMARDIYNSLNAFSAEYRVEDLSQSTQEIPDAVEKLRSVINRLEEYANANLDALEQLNRDLNEDRAFIAHALENVDRCIGDLDRLAGGDASLAEAVRGINEGLTRDVAAGLKTMMDRVQENQEAYLALIARMSFQDLTGQTLKKVIAFIEKLEFQLVSMISRHHDERAAVTLPEPEVPLQGPDTQARLALSQDNVDKMLADLGF
jgi:chemotaxis protein CheZ